MKAIARRVLNLQAAGPSKSDETAPCVCSSQPCPKTEPARTRTTTTRSAIFEACARKHKLNSASRGRNLSLNPTGRHLGSWQPGQWLPPLLQSNGHAFDCKHVAVTGYNGYKAVIGLGFRGFGLQQQSPGLEIDRRFWVRYCGAMWGV